MSGGKLAARLDAMGIPWNRTTVAKFETGYRHSITVQELLGLAIALDVPLVALLADPRTQDVVPIVEGKNGAGAVTEPAWDALLWMIGSLPLTRQTPMGQGVPAGQRPESIEELSVAMRITGPVASAHKAADQLIGDAWTVVSCLRALDQPVVLVARPDVEPGERQKRERERDEYRDGRDSDLLEQLAAALERIHLAGAPTPIITWRAKTRAAELGVKLPGAESGGDRGTR